MQLWIEEILMYQKKSQSKDICLTIRNNMSPIAAPCSQISSSLAGYQGRQKEESPLWVQEAGQIFQVSDKHLSYSQRGAIYAFLGQENVPHIPLAPQHPSGQIGE